MLTGSQLKSARQLAGIKSQGALAEMVGLSRATVERAESCGDVFPKIGSDIMAQMVQIFEERGVKFTLPEDGSAANGLRMTK